MEKQISTFFQRLSHIDINLTNVTLNIMAIKKNVNKKSYTPQPKKHFLGWIIVAIAIVLMILVYLYFEILKTSANVSGI